MVLALFFLLKTLLPIIHLLSLRQEGGGSSWSDSYRCRGRVIKWFGGAVGCDVNPLLTCSRLSTAAWLAWGGLYLVLRDFLHSGPGESFRAEHPACLPVFSQTPSSAAETHSWILSVLAFLTLHFLRRWPDKQFLGMDRLPEYHFHARSVLIFICFKGEKLSSTTETWNSRMHFHPTSKSLAKKAPTNQI